MEFYDYFQSYEDYFWNWEDNGEVLAIPKGSTIAYRDYVLTVLKHLSGQGIPPFGALLLAIIATNPGAEKSLDQAISIVKNVVSRVHRHDDVHNKIADAQAFLKVLVSLPKSYKEGNKRIQLFQAVFADCHRIVSRKKARNILDTMNSDELDIRKFTSKKALYILNLKNEFKTLGLLKNKFPDADSIIESIAALPEIEEEEILPEEVGEDYEKTDKEFLEELAENNKTYQIGTLIKHIWSGLNIPLHNTLPSLQPLGGVSGLSNKGSFDKLLISEFANDDLVFLSRIANNEALYINREIPPENNRLERIILIDVSIKNWGTPRLIAFALAIAIANHPKTDIKCKAFFVGDIYGPLHLNTVDQVIDDLLILHSSLDSSAGLEKFFRENPYKSNTEVIFISSPDTMKMPAMQKTIGDHHSRFKYWINTDSEGHIAVYRNQHNSKKLLQEITLPLAKLWHRDIKTKGKEKEKEEEFQEAAFPILFPNALNYKVVLPAPDGEIFKITAERNVFRLYDKNAGAYQKGLQMVLENIHSARDIFEIGQNEKGDYILLCFSRQNRELTIINLDTKEQQSITFNAWGNNANYRDFLFYNNAFYHIGFQRSFKISYEPKLEVSTYNSIPEDINEVNQQREKQIKEAESKAYHTKGFVKNITHVFINNLNNLVFNIHELSLNNNGHIRLKKTISLYENITATTGKSSNEFVFPDGSTITVHRSGMLIMESSNSHIPKIYIPTTLDIALGVATKDHFAGNPYFHLPKAFSEGDRYNVVLEEVGPQKLNFIKEVMNITGLKLKEASVFVDEGEGYIKKNISLSEANRIKALLREINALVSIEKATPGPLNNELTTKQFYKMYVNAFIENILAHGNYN